MMADTFPTAFLFLAAALLVPLLPGGRLRGALLLAVPAFALWQIWSLPEGALFATRFFGFELELMRVDSLSRPFAAVFALAALLGNIYAWHLRDTLQQVAALLYAGAAIGAVFAGDLLSLFFYWEGTAVASVFLIWARRTEGAYHSGMRYLLVQVGSGVLLLAGIALMWRETGDIAFGGMRLESPASWLILLGFGIKAAFPLLHNWLPDAYPAATVTGTVFLSAFTTKMAIYALARGFAGTELLLPVGVVMALFPIPFALIENDLRRVLSYSLNSQLGFMVAGIGIGSEMALNGTVAHALASVLYQGLLFMAVGAVLYRTGTVRASELGGLFRTMPATAALSLVGAASIAAFPLFSGFVTKAMIVDQAAYAGLPLVWGALVLAGVGTLFHSAIRVPLAAFFAADSARRPKEAPGHMLLAMGGAAALSVAIGVFPGAFYALLPYPVDYAPYTVGHVVGQMQLILFGMFAFALMMRLGALPPAERAVYLDTDWLWRRLLAGLAARVGGGLAAAGVAAGGFGRRQAESLVRRLYRSHGPEGRMARVWPTGAMVIWVAVLLAVTLILDFL